MEERGRSKGEEGSGRKGRSKGEEGGGRNGGEVRGKWKKRGGVREKRLVEERGEE